MVIGVIAVLLAILLPALSSVRAVARATKCAANLHQIHQMFTHYQVTWPNHLPNNSYTLADDPTSLKPPPTPGTPAADKAASRGMFSTTNIQWFDAIAADDGWVRGRSVAARASAGDAVRFRAATQYLWCPDLDQGLVDPEIYATNYGVPFNVSNLFNYQARSPQPGQGPFDFLLVRRIPRSVDVVLLTEGSGYNDNSEAYNLTNASVGNVASANGYPTLPRIRHRGINYLFSDGHVTRLQAPPHSLGSDFGDFVTSEGVTYRLTTDDDTSFRKRLPR